MVVQRMDLGGRRLSTVQHNRIISGLADTVARRAQVTSPPKRYVMARFSWCWWEVQLWGHWVIFTMLKNIRINKRHY